MTFELRERLIGILTALELDSDGQVYCRWCNGIGGHREPCLVQDCLQELRAARPAFEITNSGQWERVEERPQPDGSVQVIYRQRSVP